MRAFLVKTTKTSKGPNWCTIVSLLQREPDSSGNPHIDSDHIRSRKRSFRCKTFWRRT